MYSRLSGLFIVLATLLILSACGGNLKIPSGGTATTTVQVKETDFQIGSSLIIFSTRTPYHFVVNNAGQTAHEFLILPRAMGSMSGMPARDMDHMALASISYINPGETKTLDYTFPSSSLGSHPQLACYFPGHYESGMKLDISVQA